jgi:polyferredoxin
VNRKKRARRIIWVRRGVQTFFLLLFVVLVLTTRTVGEDLHGGGMRYFFYFDPLVTLATFLSAHAVPILTLLAAVTIAVTMVFGRVFCGWVCPLGTMNAAVGGVHDRYYRNVSPPKDQWSPWQRTKYLLLAGLIVMALSGVHWIGVFDPISIAYRGVATVVLPAAQYAVDGLSTAIYQGDPHIGPVHLTSVSEPVYRFFRDRVFLVPRQAFDASLSIALLFGAILLLNIYRRRFWCRYLCPLGALLGVFAWRPLLRLQQDDKACGECGKCAAYCQGAASPDHLGKWLPQECFGCWNCVGTCSYRAIDFNFGSPLTAASHGTLDLSRRAVLTAGAGGVAAALTWRMTPQAQGRSFNPSLIRPPGAREETAFLQRCVQCGACMKACPTNGLQPTLFEAGLEGLWTPRLVPLLGYCAYECTACGEVCPTAAIEAFPLEQKKDIKIGLAAIDTTRCIPYAYDRECIVCEEHCPIPDKAITFLKKEVVLRDGSTRVVKQPRVDPELCTGCGICENKCVFKDLPAIRVTSANETRHPRNQPILPGLSGGYEGSSSGDYGY